MVAFGSAETQPVTATPTIAVSARSKCWIGCDMVKLNQESTTPRGMRPGDNLRVEFLPNRPTVQRGGGSLEHNWTTLSCSFSFRRRNSRVCSWGVDRDVPQHDWHFDGLV